MRFHSGVDKAYALSTLLDGRIIQPIHLWQNAISTGRDGHGKLCIEIAPILNHPLGEATSQPNESLNTGIDAAALLATVISLKSYAPRLAVSNGINKQRIYENYRY